MSTTLSHRSSITIHSQLPAVLIVDDDRHAAQYISSIFRRAGFRALVAASAQDAVALLASASKQIETFVISAHVSKLTGPALMRTLGDVNPHSSVIYTLSHRAESLNLSPAEAKACSILVKPFTEAELLACTGHRKPARVQPGGAKTLNATG